MLWATRLLQKLSAISESSNCQVVSDYLEYAAVDCWLPRQVAS